MCALRVVHEPVDGAEDKRSAVEVEESGVGRITRRREHAYENVAVGDGYPVVRDRRDRLDDDAAPTQLVVHSRRTTFAELRKRKRAVAGVERRVPLEEAPDLGVDVYAAADG